MVKPFVLLLPWLYLGVAALLHDGLRLQPHVVQAGSPERFALEVAAAGGVESVRAGLLLDMVFVVAFVAVTATVLARGAGGWWLPLIPATLDLAENVLTAVLVDQRPTEGMTQVLAAVAVLKLVGYFLVVGIVLWRALRRHSRV